MLPRVGTTDSISAEGTVPDAHSNWLKEGSLAEGAERRCEGTPQKVPTKHSGGKRGWGRVWVLEERSESRFLAPSITAGDPKRRDE